MRAFDCEPGTAVLAEGLRVHYNLVRDRQAMGMTPGEGPGSRSAIDLDGSESSKRRVSRDVFRRKIENCDATIALQFRSTQMFMYQPPNSVVRAYDARLTNRMGASQ
jgi:hypothetical protein